MQRNITSKLFRRATQIRSISSKRAPIFRQIPAAIKTTSCIRPFSTTPSIYKGISPESENPQPKEPEPESANATGAAPADLSVEEYNQLSDEYMDAILQPLESLQEEREDVDVEYSAGVLTLTFPPNGTYIINKQPPNKQIWLSSPISGPKRYDYVLLGEGQGAKEGTATGEWIYLRDMSTLAELLEKEVGVTVQISS